MDILGSEITEKDGRLTLDVYRNIEGNPIRFTYNLDDVILSSAFDLAGGKSEEKVKEALLTKGVSGGEIQGVLKLVHSNLNAHKSKFDEILEHIKQHGSDLDSFCPGWREIPLNDKMSVINAHIESKSQESITNNSAQDRKQQNSNNFIFGVLFSVAVIIIFLVVLMR